MMIVAAMWVEPQTNRNIAVVVSAAVVAGLLVASWSLMLASRSSFADRIARLLWTSGFLALVLHIVLAFALVHEWSHEAAVEHVRQVGGFGAGIIVNYLFAAVWMADLVWWWANPRTRAARPIWMGWLLHGFLGFVMLNATVVFGPPERRGFYVSLCVLAVLGAARTRWVQEKRKVMECEVE